MAMPLDTFVGQVVESQLLTADELRLFIEGCRQDKRPQDGEQLARELVKQKKLTAYQAKAIYQGKGKSLMLGNYRILDKLGQGGMGMVLKAEHRRMERLVALKVLSPQFVKDPGALQRFLREVKAAARLSHPNIVTAYDADDVQGTHFLVMEYVEGPGPGLARPPARAAAGREGGQLRAAGGPRPRLCPPQRRDSPRHQALEPAARHDGNGQGPRHGPGPARARSVRADRPDRHRHDDGDDRLHVARAGRRHQARRCRSDIYSLGCTLHFLLTARQVYASTTMVSKLWPTAKRRFPSLREQRGDVPAAVEALFQQDGGQAAGGSPRFDGRSDRRVGAVRLRRRFRHRKSSRLPRPKIASSKTFCSSLASATSASSSGSQAGAAGLPISAPAQLGRERSACAAAEVRKPALEHPESPSPPCLHGPAFEATQPLAAESARPGEARSIAPGGWLSQALARRWVAIAAGSCARAACA